MHARRGTAVRFPYRPLGNRVSGLIARDRQVPRYSGQTYGPMVNGRFGGQNRMAGLGFTASSTAPAA